LAEAKHAEIEKIHFRLQMLPDSFPDGIIYRNNHTGEKSKLMSRKKSLKEQRSALATGQAHDWLEPFSNWILTAGNAGEIALSGSLQEKRFRLESLRPESGPRLQKSPWFFRQTVVTTRRKIVEGEMVRDRGFEPLTPSVSRKCSTTELTAQCPLKDR
jgi:hypothetical protein